MADLYESTTFEAVHAGILDLLPVANSSVLDVGAGSGRDAAALARRGCMVTAVEPSAGFRREALNRHPDSRIRWLNDALPHLSKLTDQRFSLVLVSAVWMHIAPQDRPSAIRRLAKIVEPGGHLIISIRIGADNPARSIMYVDLQPLEVDAKSVGLMLVKRIDSGDALGRSSVHWVTLAFGKPM